MKGFFNLPTEKKEKDARQSELVNKIEPFFKQKLEKGTRGGQTVYVQTFVVFPIGTHFTGWCTNVAI